MLRWNDVEDLTINDMVVKMYRPPFVAKDTKPIPSQGLDLDHIAYKYLGSELLMYQILDANFIEYIENRGDVSRIKNLVIPVNSSGSL